ncbi:hypothetical protein [Actinomadura sp. NTSP31]|uniref:hypothetical protein n=1 Tax=Actinomadura sp. NTSP31 TaxID=1735447 RepID=UPI0035C1FB5A
MRLRFHDLRHGAAKLSLLGKVDMKVSSATLGSPSCREAVINEWASGSWVSIG